MPIFKKDLPLSLYIHLPWCVRKCPYCDFNSHTVKDHLPETLYVEALISELKLHQKRIKTRLISSIFFGGGTPSLFSAMSIQTILTAVRDLYAVAADVEITLEANPGTVESNKFEGFRSASVNRLSIGIQSFNLAHLKKLGRIHSDQEAMKAIQIAKQAGFDNLNIDLMYGLPGQCLKEAISDLEIAMQFSPSHLSWYQLTLEPNTLFAHQPPSLPADDLIFELQQQGQLFLSQQGYQQYEVSAYSRGSFYCRHNLNYWLFGDYLGIGAGAHSKITDIDSGEVQRFAQVKNPKDYLDVTKRKNYIITIIRDRDLLFEFMLNALRLTNGFDRALLTEHTGIQFEVGQELILSAVQRDLLTVTKHRICPTEKGKFFLNDLTAIFLPS